MNTLSRALTAQILTNPETYYNLRAHWRMLMCSPRKHELKAAHHLLYLGLLGKDWRRGFTPIANRRKLENGAYFGWALFRALAALHLPSREAELLAPFDGLVSSTMLQHMRRFIPAPNADAYQPEQFTTQSFPFEAYCLPATVKAKDQNA